MTRSSKSVSVGLYRLFAGAALGGSAFAACTGSGSNTATPGGGGQAAAIGDFGGGRVAGGGFSPTVSEGGAGGAGGNQAQSFDVLPAEGDPALTLTVDPSQPLPAVSFTAVSNGKPRSVGWNIDRGELGTLAPRMGSASVFTASNLAAGTATITAAFNTLVVKRHVVIKIASSQNGANASDAKHDVDEGGGVGGVGGEGVGVALDPVKDKATLDALGAPKDPKSQNLVVLYPYDATVFPRGVLPPLVQWGSSLGDADAVAIKLTTKDGAFSYSGTFGRPALLGAGAFVRHPIPIDAWNAALRSAAGDNTITLSLIVAKGGVAYGPIQQTYTVAPALLTGTVYYNSYGTSLVQNWGAPSAIDSSGTRAVGAAVLAIRSGDTKPKVAVGENTASVVNGKVVGDSSGCRVCHVVSAGGGRLLAQGDGQSMLVEPSDPTKKVSNGRTFGYDLKSNTAQETAPAYDGKLGWAALDHEGDIGLTNTIDPSGTNRMVASATSSVFTLGANLSDPSQVVDVTANAKGLPAKFGAGYPAFSADNHRVAFTYASGDAVNNLRAVDPMANTGQDRFKQLAVAEFDKNTLAFSNFRGIANAPDATRLGFPSFLPGGDALVYQVETRSSFDTHDTVMVTRSGARGELWWATLSNPMPVRLNRANGKSADGAASYLPTGGNDHGLGNGGPEANLDDTTLNYEPTVLPVTAGGYAWVVFTSRRLYGNMGVRAPWDSDPRTYSVKDYQSDHTRIPTKKLWVTAIDMNAPAGTDPSHPAFYLPAQEIVAGNSRGYWVLDPCKNDGDTCETGDQCCGGFCQPNGANGALICSQKIDASMCSLVQDKCTTDADCCGAGAGVQCIGGFCSASSPNTPH